MLYTDAKKFKDAFIKCQDELPQGNTTDEQESNKLAKELEGLTVKESKEEEDKENKSENKDNETDSKSSETEESETTAKKDSSVESEDTPEK